MRLISNLKRAGYLGAAAVLVLTAMPIGPISQAFAEGTTEVDSCDELSAALGDDNGVVELTTSLTGCPTMTLTKAKVIDGGGQAITFVSGGGFSVNTNDSIEFKDVTVNTNHRGIDVNSSVSDLTLDNVILNVGQRGITYSVDNSNGAKLVVNNSIIQNNTVTNYDADWFESDSSRGISFWNFANSTVDITDTTIQGFKYVVNMAPGSGDFSGSTFNLTGVTLKGWGDLNMWQSNATVNVTDSDLLGIMAQDDSNAWNNFADVVLNTGASGNAVTLNGVRFKNAYPYATSTGVAMQAMIGGGNPLSSNNTVVLNDCDFVDALPGRLTVGAIYNMGGNTVEVNSGTYDVAINQSHLGDDKVNYLVNGRYVVDDAPVVDDVPARILVAGGVDTEVEGLNGTNVQEYGSFEANGGSFTKPNTINATRISNSSDLKLTFDIYTYNNNGEVVKDESYDKTVKVHAYRADKIDDVYMTKGSTKNDLSLSFESNPYTTMEVKTSDESIATISKNAEGGDYTVNALEDGTVKILGKVSVADLTTEWIELGTVKVYSFDAESEVTIPVGTEVDLQDGVISQIGNPSAIDVEVEGDAVSLSGDATTGATAESTLTAVSAGDATLTFKAGETELGTTRVKVYALQNPDDVVLRTLLSQGSNTIANSIRFREIISGGTNLPSYEMSANNNHVIVNNNTFLLSNRIIARSAGDSVVTVKYDDSLETTETFNVRVSEFISTANSRYDVAKNDTISFRMNEVNNQSFVKCEINGHACEEDTDFTITQSGSNGTYNVRVTGADAGTYTLKFTDTFTNVMKDGEPTEVKVAEETVVIRVHEVEALDEEGNEVNELFIKTDGDPAEITVREKNNYNNRIGWTIRDDAGNLILLGNQVQVSQSGEDVTIKVNEAGYYTIEFQDCSTKIANYCINGVASKTVEIYGIDFEVNDLEYHVNNNDTSNKLINAINHYWGEDNHGGSTTAGDVTHLDGHVSSRFRVTSAEEGSVQEGDGYNFRIRNGGAGADHYTLELSALIGDKIVDTKTVDIYVYNMSHPSQDTYYDEVVNGNAVTFENIDVDDDLNAIVPGIAVISAEVTSGDETAVDLSEVGDGKVKISKPGQYQVTFTDTMNYGEEGLVADTWTATFNVYGLSAEVEDGIVNLSANETYNWTIDSAETYGTVRTTIRRRGPTGSPSREIYRSEIRYDGTGTEVEEHSFDPAQYGEGRYTIRIENTSVGRHRLPAIVEEATFYVIAREYDFVMVEQGETITITSDSRWSVDFAEEYYSGELTVDDHMVTLDTSELPLGPTWVALDHEFDINDETERVPLKWVNVVVYKVVPSENTKELNPGEVTTATIKELYERAAEATAGLIRDLIAAGVPEDNVYCSLYSIDCHWAWGELTISDMMIGEHLTQDDIAEAFGLTDEQAAMVNINLIQQAVDKFKTAFGGNEENETGLRTAALLNLVNSEIFAESNTPLETEVRVTPIADSDVDADEKVEIEKALANAGIKVDNIDYYDVSVLMKMRGLEIGKLHMLNDKITVALAKTEEPASGYTRQYFVVRDHNGTVTVLVEGVDFYIEDGVIYVISDEFSTYAVAYKDTLIPKSPNTGDETKVETDASSVSLGTAIVIAMASIVLVGTVIFVKRK